VYAEDPAREFIPQAGRVLLYREPRLPGVRVDSGIMEGTDVPVHYDPLLAKVIAYGESREVARVRLLTALRDFPILGVVTNVPFLCRILDHQDFIEGRTDTRFLEREGPALTTSIEPPAFVRAAIDAAEGEDFQRLPPGESREVWDPWKQLRQWRA
jgi:acetyl-CoA/propionyl-CoA carboxylase biotin carboxyl carrier protein